MKEKRQLAGSHVAYEILLRGWLMRIIDVWLDVTVTLAKEMETITSSP